MELVPTKMGVHIKCRSMAHSLEFYRKLGFQPIFAYGPDNFIVNFTCPVAPEKYCGVIFEIGGGLYEIADGHMAIKPEVFMESVESSKVSAMFDIKSVDELEKFCKQEKLEVAVPPRVFPWGTKEIVLRDPDGFILVFREHV